MTRARWAAEVEARARAYWTDDRTAQLLGDKQLVIRPAEGAVLLRALGLLRDDGSLPANQLRKYFQINHMVALLGPALRVLRANHPTIRLLDIGCGRSYLTLLLAWCARELWHHPVHVVGIDRNADLVAESRRRAELAGLDDVIEIELGDAADHTDRAFHGVVALHACDTATCDAIALGVGMQADLIAVAPCCQAELARGWAQLADRGTPGALSTIWRTPQLRRETAADITDAMRVALLTQAGYDVHAIEFVPAEHTRKNTLIYALRGSAGDASYEQLRDATGGCDIRLAHALQRARCLA